MKYAAAMILIALVSCTSAPTQHVDHGIGSGGHPSVGARGGRSATAGGMGHTGGGRGSAGAASGGMGRR